MLALVMWLLLDRASSLLLMLFATLIVLLLLLTSDECVTYNNSKVIQNTLFAHLLLEFHAQNSGAGVEVLKLWENREECRDMDEKSSKGGRSDSPDHESWLCSSCARGTSHSYCGLYGGNTPSAIGASSGPDQ